MVSGLGLTLYYVLVNQPGVRETFGITRPIQLWGGIQPIAAGLFGVPAGFVVLVAVSLLTPPPSRAALAMVDDVRIP